jgi:hypothetical protein
MKLTKLMTAAAVLSMATAPVVAQAASQPAPARDSSSVASAENLRGGFIIPLVAVIAIILGILAMTGGDNDPPHSP